MLPLLLGLGGSALAGAGMLGTMTPLMAGALGSGLGSLAQGDDLGTAIGTGFLSYMGGKALGSAFGGADKAIPSGVSPASRVTATPTGIPGAINAIKSPAVIGMAGTAALPSLMKPVGVDMPEEGEGPPEAETAKYQKFTPGASYRPGYDPEFRYFKPFAGGGIAELRYQDGGEVSEPNDKEIISQAVNAIKGRSENTEMVLGRFLTRYGEEALKDLVERVNSGQFDEDQTVEEGKVNGIGDGMDDMIPATLEGEQDVVLSDGEFIVPADVVSGLGNGSTDAGASALYEMMDRVRQLRTGKTEQPKQVPQGEMLPA